VWRPGVHLLKDMGHPEGRRAGSTPGSPVTSRFYSTDGPTVTKQCTAVLLPIILRLHVRAATLKKHLVTTYPLIPLSPHPLIPLSRRAAMLKKHLVATYPLIPLSPHPLVPLSPCHAVWKAAGMSGEGSTYPLIPLSPHPLVPSTPCHAVRKAAGMSGEGSALCERCATEGSHSANRRLRGGAVGPGNASLAWARRLRAPGGTASWCKCKGHLEGINSRES